MVKSNPAHRLFLIGDSGKPSLEKPDEVLTLLQLKMKEAGKNSSVVFLGDNIYPKGLPPMGDQKRSLSEKRLLTQLDLIKDHPGNIFFISGNHDWNKGKRGGLQFVKRQENYIVNYLKRENIYLPSKGCPGPEEVIINGNLRLIFINTQWWIQKGRTPSGSKDGCKADNGEHFFKLLEEMILKDGQQTIVLGHHPLYSESMHGGVFSPKQHLFPLRFVHKKLYIPIPLAGSIYPLYRKYFGVAEDIAYPPYRKMKNKLLNVFKKSKDLIYVSGHDHNLQYIKKGEQHFLISGSGSKASFVRKGRNSVFSYSVKGFLELAIHPNNEIELIAWEASSFYPSGNMIYKSKIIIAES